MDALPKKVIIIGAGREGRQLLREIEENHPLGLQVGGFIDDNPDFWGKEISGVPVLGSTSGIHSFIQNTGAQEIFIADQKITPNQILKIMESVTGLPVSLKRLPDLSSFITGRLSANQLKHVSPEDLLRRKQVELDTAATGSMISGKTVLITGAGGSIGSEIVRQVIRFRPQKLILVDFSELFLYEIRNELLKTSPGIQAHYHLSDIRSDSLINKLFHQYKPDTVFHAAAYKHVPLLEDNPWEAIVNNIKGTINVAKAAGDHNAGQFILLSTDKAVNPTNVMGATKRICEMVCTDLQKQFPETRFIAVRFGNVLGSTGSVIPLFKQQIEEGGPVTVTHPEICRYFMSIPEAVQLVMQAGAMGSGGEVFVLEMGEPVKIADLARDMITLAGFIPEKEIPIVYTGLRPGEKLYEELLTDAESTVATSHPGIRIAKLSDNAAKFRDCLDALINDGVRLTNQELFEKLKELVPEYGPAVGESRRNAAMSDLS